MGLFEDIGNWFDQAVEDVGAAVEEAVDWVEQAVEDVGEWVDQAVEDTGEWLEDAAEVVVDVAEDVAEWTLNTLDDVVFDPVDFITGGVIDIDYDDGQFSAGLDIGIASVGISVGAAGFSAESSFDIGLASGSISYDETDGLAMSGSIGVDWGPLPYAEGHMNIGPGGEIWIGGELQGALPLPGGEIGGEISGGFGRRADGTWGAVMDTELHGNDFLGGFAVDSHRGIELDADGNLTVESSTSGDLDLPDLDLDLDGGLLGGGRPADANPDQERYTEQTDRDSGDVDDSDDDLFTNLDKAADAQREIRDATQLGLTSEATREVDDITGTDFDLDTAPTDTATTDAATIDTLAPVDTVQVDTVQVDTGTVEGLAPVDEFAPIDEFVPVEVPLEPVMPEPVMPEPEPAPDFSQEIAEIDTIEESADELWDDLG